MKQNWAYQIPHYHFDEAGTGGTAAPASTPAPTPASGEAPAATPSPTPAPSVAPSSTQPAPAAGAPSADPGSDPFAGMDSDFDDDVIVLPPEAGTDPAAAAAPATPTPAPAATPAAQPTPAASQQPAPAAQAAPAPSQTAASPRAALDEAIEGFKKNEAELANWAGQNIFKLSDEDAQALATNAEEVIPRLMGKVYNQAIAAAGNLIRNFVPAMIEHSVGEITTKTAKSKEALDQFYKTNSDLNQKDHGDLIAQWAKAYRMTNPKATREQAIEYVGKAVRLQLGLPMPGSPAPAAARPAAFAPARQGGHVPPPAATHDPFAGLDHDFDEG